MEGWIEKGFYWYTTSRLGSNDSNEDFLRSTRKSWERVDPRRGAGNLVTKIEEDIRHMFFECLHGDYHLIYKFRAKTMFLS